MRAGESYPSAGIREDVTFFGDGRRMRRPRSGGVVFLCSIAAKGDILFFIF